MNLQLGASGSTRYSVGNISPLRTADTMMIHVLAHVLAWREILVSGDSSCVTWGIDWDTHAASFVCWDSVREVFYLFEYLFENLC